MTKITSHKKDVNLKFTETSYLQIFHANSIKLIYTFSDQKKNLTINKKLFKKCLKCLMLSQHNFFYQDLPRRKQKQKTKQKKEIKKKKSTYSAGANEGNKVFGWIHSYIYSLKYSASYCQVFIS